eukprot:24720_1
MATKVRVACIQTNNTESKTTNENLNDVTSFIQVAVEKGAKLILFPELMPNEYIFDTEIWNFAETLRNGSSLKFISQQSKKHKVYIGLSFLEVDGLHFYNTFIMTDSNGNLICKIRKNPAALEAFYFNGYKNKHMFKTKDFGNIFVGICYENYLGVLENELIEYQNSNNKISMILQPHSSPFAKPKKNDFNVDAVKSINDTVNNVSIEYAKKYNIPVLFCNKVGKFRSKLLNNPQMGGWTKIVNYNGNIVAKSENYGVATKPVHEVIVGDIDIIVNGNDNKQYDYINNSWNRWNRSLYHTFQIGQFIGSLYYQFSIKRRIKASKISKHPWLPSYAIHIVWISTAIYTLFR